jgi:hypothetical protein
MSIRKIYIYLTELFVEDNIKFLVSQGLSRLFLPPYAYSLEIWRWSVVNGSIQPYEYNKRYWDLVLSLRIIF